jgi:protein phosphatase
VHGCATEVADLFTALGYAEDAAGVWRSSQGRVPVFIGDIVDRGPQNVEALRLVMRMVNAGAAFCLPGNHDMQMQKYLAGETVPIVWGLEVTVAELERESQAFRDTVRDFFGGLKGHYVFDDGKLVVAHTGLPERLHGVDTPEVTRQAAYGAGEGEMDPGDMALRHPWVETYTGEAAVVYGHTRVLEPVWRHNTIDIDTGCVYGWRLTALQWPERRLVSVPARAIHFRSTRPFLPEAHQPAPR